MAMSAIWFGSVNTTWKSGTGSSSGSNWTQAEAVLDRDRAHGTATVWPARYLPRPCALERGPH
jgi:hypothetical protein